MAVANPVPLSALKSAPVVAAAPQVWMLPSESGLEWTELAHYINNPTSYSGPLTKLFNGIGVTEPFYKSEESLYPSRNLIISDENLRKFQEISKISDQIDDNGMPLNAEAEKAFEDLMNFTNEIEPMMFPEHLLSYGGVSQKQLDKAASNAPQDWRIKKEQRASEVAHKKAEKLKKDEEDKKSKAKIAIDKMYSRSRMDYAGGSEDVEGLDYTTLESISMNNKAKELVAQLLGENNGDSENHDDSLLSDILHGDPFGEYLKVLSVEADGEQFIVAKHSRGHQYVYTTGYDGGTSRTYDVVIESVKRLREFDDFYGNPSKYPVIAQINQALDEAGSIGQLFCFTGLGAGSLKAAAARWIPPE